MSDDRFLSTAQAAEFTGFSPDTLRTWRSRGRGPAWSKAPGGSIRYRLADLRAYVTARGRE